MNQKLDPSDPDLVRENLSEALTRPGAFREVELPERHASVAVVVHLTAAGPATLWIERAKNPKDPWSGQMAFPGGKGDQEDSSPRHTAEREAEEEVGLDLQAEGFHLGPLTELRARNDRGFIGLRVVPHVYFLPELPALTTDPGEVFATHSVPLAHTLDPGNSFEHVVTYHGTSLRLPAIDFDGRIIWGLSLRILRDLQRRLEGTPLHQALRGGDG